MKSLELLNDLVYRYPTLLSAKEEIQSAAQRLYDSFTAGNKILIAGNGGSAADAEHMVGELMKSFVIKNRQADSLVASSLTEKFGPQGKELADKLEGALPAIPLTGFLGLSTAFSNDVGSQVLFAQQVYALGQKGDVFFAISTSGNSKNLINALMVADIKGLTTIGLTGRSGGLFNKYCQNIIHAPEDETYKIQELHLPIYHTLCLILEAELFGS